MLGRVVVWTVLGGKGFALGPILLVGAAVGALLTGFGYLMGKKSAINECEDENEVEVDDDDNTPHGIG